VIEAHLPRTYIDGAALCALDGYPIVALTLRYDRLDNFWFTLLHELVHVKDHIQHPSDVFVDDLDFEDSDDLREIDADHGSSTALIPEKAWHSFNARGQFTQDAIERFAVEQHIHVSIVAGRIRRLRRNYRILNNLVGQDSVRRLFAGS
jgi:HTH-type transcriptional regulator/antitoxin HigA